MKLEKPSKVSEMSEAAQAHNLVLFLALPARMQGANKKGEISHVYGLLRKHRKWTWRRVKSFYYGEVSDDAVRARELRELKEAAYLAQARKEHARFTAETERLAAIHFPQDEDFYGAEIEARRGFMGRVDGTRAGGGAE
jgi:hypothetical protein